MTISELIQEHGITSQVSRIPQRTDGTKWEFDRNAAHYNVTITAHGESMSVEYSQGAAYTAPPKLVDVLWCLSQDVQMISDYQPTLAGFLAWANDFDIGKRGTEYQAEQTWESIRQTERHLRRLGLTALIDGTVDTSDE